MLDGVTLSAYWDFSLGPIKVSGRYATAGVVIEIDSLEVLPFAAVTDDDVRASGETDREALRERAAHSGPISDGTLVYRIEFHVV